MTTFTAKIEASNAAGDIWQGLAPAQSDDYPEGWIAEDVALLVAANQNVAEGCGWRVVVWDGADADEGSEPAYVYYAEPKTRRDS